MSEQVKFVISIEDLASGPLKAFAKTATKEVGKVQKLFASLEKTFGRTSASLKNLDRSMKVLSGSQGTAKLNGQLKTANGHLDRMVSKAGKLRSVMAGTRMGGMGGYGGGVGRRGGGFMGGMGFGAGLLGGIGGPLAAVYGMQQMISTGAQLQSQLVDIRAILASSDGFSPEAFEGLTKKMKQLGADTIFTGRQIMGASKYMAMAGLNIKQIEESMPAVADIAAIGNMEIERSADIITNIQTSYGIAAKNMVNVADVMARTLNGANVNMEEMGESFKYSGNEAARAGIDFKEFSAAVGVLGDNGIKASMAGTNLRQMLIRMKAPVREAQKVLDKYNYSFTETVDGKTKMKSLTKIIQEINGKNMSPMDIKKLFGVYGGSAFGALSTTMDGDKLKLETLSGKNAEAGGIARQIAEKKMATFRGSIEKMRGQFELFSDHVFIRFEPILTKVVGVFERLFRTINADGSPALDAISRGFTFLGVVLRGVYELFKGLYRFIRDNIEVMKKLALVALALYGVFKLFTIIRGITTAMWGLNAAMAANPVALVITAFVALGAIFVLLYQKSKGFRGTMLAIDEVLREVGTAFGEAVEGIEGFINTISALWTVKMAPMMNDLDTLERWGSGVKGWLGFGGKKASPNMVANSPLAPNGQSPFAFGNFFPSAPTRKFEEKDRWRKAVDRGHARAENGGERLDFAGIYDNIVNKIGIKPTDPLKDVGNFSATGDVSSAIPVKMGGGLPDGDGSGSTSGSGSGSGSDSVNSYRGSGSVQGGLVINVENLFNITTQRILDGLGGEGIAIKEELVKQFVAIIRDTEASYGA